MVTNYTCALDNCIIELVGEQCKFIVHAHKCVMGHVLKLRCAFQIYILVQGECCVDLPSLPRYYIFYHEQSLTSSQLISELMKRITMVTRYIQ